MDIIGKIVFKNGDSVIYFKEFYESNKKITLKKHI
jgi:hypothetical protein